MAKKKYSKKEYSRAEQAVMLVLYKSHSRCMSKGELDREIQREGLLTMSDEEFSQWKLDLGRFTALTKGKE